MNKEIINFINKLKNEGKLNFLDDIPLKIYSEVMLQ